MRIAAWLICVALAVSCLDARKLTQAERMSKAEEASMKSRQTWLNLYKSPSGAAAAPPAPSPAAAPAAAPSSTDAAPPAPTAAAAAPPEADDAAEDAEDAPEADTAAVTAPKPQKSQKELGQEAAR